MKSDYNEYQKTYFVFTYKGILVKYLNSDAADSVERQFLQRVVHVGNHFPSLARSPTLLRSAAVPPALT